MPRFYSAKHKALIHTSFKVGFSTLTYQRHLRLIKEPVAALATACGYVKRHILLVRHPHKRTFSFWNDKFQTYPERAHSTLFPGWQDCHRTFAPHLGINISEDKVHTAREFQNVTFDAFVQLLPKLWQHDYHLWPQSNLLDIGLLKMSLSPRPSVPWTPDAVFDLQQDWDKLCSEIEINPNVHANESGSQQVFSITTEQANIIDQLYASDFHLYHW